MEAAETTVLKFLGGRGKEETGLDAAFASLPGSALREALPQHPHWPGKTKLTPDPVPRPALVSSLDPRQVRPLGVPLLFGCRS